MKHWERWRGALMRLWSFKPPLAPGSFQELIDKKGARYGGMAKLSLVEEQDTLNVRRDSSQHIVSN